MEKSIFFYLYHLFTDDFIYLFILRLAKFIYPFLICFINNLFFICFVTKKTQMRKEKFDENHINMIRYLLLSSSSFQFSFWEKIDFIVEKTEKEKYVGKIYILL